MQQIAAGRTWRARLGYAAIAFGSWDILYYVFLRIISGWPASLFDWDILFLLPLPWWGPVLAPVCIASLMIVWGTLVTQRQDLGGADRCDERLRGDLAAEDALAEFKQQAFDLVITDVSLPAIGATLARARGQAVSRMPVSVALRPSTVWK